MKQNQSPNTSKEIHIESAVSYTNSLAEMDVYNELADQPNSKVDVLAQIHQQLNQLETSLAKRQFLAKEISQYIIKS